MSASFRPVRVAWGPASDQFVEHEELVIALELLAERQGIKTETTEHADLTEVWMEDGRQFLNSLSGKIDFDLAGEVGIEDKSDLDSLLSNLRHPAKQWNAFLDEEDGSLRLWID